MKNLKTKVTLSCATLLIVGGSVYSYTSFQNHQGSLPKQSSVQTNNKISNSNKVIKSAHALVVNENGTPAAQALNSEVNDNKTFDEVLNSGDTSTSTQSVEGSEITTITNNDNETVAAISVSDNQSGLTVSIVNNGTNVTVTKTSIDDLTGEPKVEEQTFALQNTTGDAQAMAWTSWGYTNIAVGARVFAYAVDTAVVGLGTAAVAACLPGAIAAAVGCSVTSAKGFVSFTAGVSFGYLATVKSPGQWLSSKLDTNRNGWIAIYYRHNPTTGAAQWKTV
ncbi:hypothetical protein ACTCUF_00285 [Lactococcus lactis]|uniref:hypothetical protein n=1 Tax=Lactococcus lactis TaxID=1358 RepID=UPI003F82A63F